jgi:hypothetical protein
MEITIAGQVFFSRSEYPSNLLGLVVAVHRGLGDQIIEVARADPISPFSGFTLFHILRNLCHIDLIWREKGILSHLGQHRMNEKIGYGYKSGKRSAFQGRKAEAVNLLILLVPEVGVEPTRGGSPAGF